MTTSKESAAVRVVVARRGRSRRERMGTRERRGFNTGAGAMIFDEMDAPEVLEGKDGTGGD